MSSFYSEEELKKIGFKEYGENVFISRNCSIYGANKMIIGNNVRIDDFCILSGKIEIKNYVHIAAGTYLFAGETGIFLNNYSGISSRSVIYAITDDYSGEYMTNPMIPDKYKNIKSGPVVLEEHVIVGTGCTILPNVTIKKGASIGAMSLVNKNVDSFTINVGIPTKIIKQRSKNLLKLSKKFEEENN